MALTTLISSFILFTLLRAQVVPVGTDCTVDECVLSLIPTYDDGVGDWDQILECIDYQANVVTST